METRLPQETIDEILDWRATGLPCEVIAAALDVPLDVVEFHVRKYVDHAIDWPPERTECERSSDFLERLFSFVENLLCRRSHHGGRS